MGGILPRLSCGVLPPRERSDMNCPWHSSCQFGSVCRVEFCTDYSVAVLSHPAIDATTTAATATAETVTNADSSVIASACASYGSVNTFANYLFVAWAFTFECLSSVATPLIGAP